MLVLFEKKVFYNLRNTNKLYICRYHIKVFDYCKCFIYLCNHFQRYFLTLEHVRLLGKITRTK